MNKPKIEYRKIPITVLQGFLGAGKTTLLNYILTHNEGMNIGVVVNDFGDINIDAELIKSQTDKKLELTSGCICCSLQTLDLQEAIDQFVSPGGNIDYIIIEASGLAEPRDLAITLRDTIGQKVRLDSIVTVLDAENLEKNASANDTARDQIIFSDFVVINKVDLVDKSKVRDIHRLIDMFNPKARILETVRGELDVRLVLDTDLYKTGAGTVEATHDHDHHDHVHEHYQQFVWTSNKPLDPREFEKFANRQIPTSVYRAKGLLDFGLKGHQRRYIFQLVGVRAEIVWDNWPNDTKHKSELVFIGQDLDEKKLITELEACIDLEPDQALPKNIELKLPKKADL